MPKSIFAKRRKRCWIKYWDKENTMHVFDHRALMEPVRYFSASKDIHTHTHNIHSLFAYYYNNQAHNTITHVTHVAH